MNDERKKRQDRKHASTYREKRKGDPERLERHRKYQREWEAKNKLKRVYDVKKARCRKLGISFNVGREEFLEWYMRSNLCYYCGSKMEGKRNKQIDRMNPSDGYILSNMVLACFTCNRGKSDIFTAQEWSEIAERYKLKDREQIDN